MDASDRPVSAPVAEVLPAAAPAAPLSRLPWPHLAVPGVVFFCTIGFLADCMNFNVILTETFLAEKRLGADEAALGRLGAISALGYTVPSLAMGLLSERVGRRPMLLAAMAGLMTTFLFFPSVETLPQLYTLALMRAVSTALLWPPLMAWMSQISEPAALGRVLGRYNISWASGILVGYIISGWVTERIGTDGPFRVSMGLSTAMLLFVLVAVPRPIREKMPEEPSCPGEEGNLRSSFFSLDAAEARLWILRGLTLMGLGCAVQGMVLYLTTKLVGSSVGEHEQGILHAVRTGGQVIGFLAFAATGTWHFRLWPVLASLGCLAAGLIVSWLAGPHAASSSGYAVLGLGYGMIGFGFGIAFMLSSYYALGLFRTKGMGSGLMETLVGGGGLLGPFLAGEIAARTSLGFALLAALLPLAAAALLAVPWERPGRARV